jgi:methylenetetrahydrofolate dehydrogenase (NADP+)/methenyltetrahydrofolate cyclohydrolase
VLEAIAVDKDVDGFHAENVGALAQGNPRFIPCTPYGVMKMFEKGNVDLSRQGSRRHRPLQHRRQADGAAADQCRRHRHRLQLAHPRPQASTPAVPTSWSPPSASRKFVTADMVKPGAVVIDVGINRLPDGKLCGDVDFAGCLDVAGQITPVPGGVGPMTITMLLANTIEAAERKAGL